MFGNLAQDGRGRIHAVWLGDRGLTYRASRPNGKRFGRKRLLSRRSSYFNLVVAANPKGKAAVAYDANRDSGRVGGFTAG